MEKDLSYYLTLYKFEGHETWRVHLGSKVSNFDEQWANQKQGKVPKVTEKIIMRIDRLTGCFSQYNEEKGS